MRSLIGVIFFVSAFPSVCFGDWLCLSENAAGYAFNETIDDWKPTVFSNGNKLVLREGKRGDYVFDEDGAPNWSLVGVGDQNPRLVCNSDFSDYGDLQCGNFLQFFWFNRDKLRFMYIYRGGYVNRSDSGGGLTPFMAIGECVEISSQ